MDANGRKAFWDALLNVKLDNPQSIEALRQAATPPRLLCRFRPVSENSLLQLQENKLYYSSADYYDDPFDTYFYIDLTNLKRFVETLKQLLAGKNESIICRNCPSGQHPPQFYPVFYSDERYDASRFALICWLIQNDNWKTLPPIAQQCIMNNVAWEVERISLIKKKCHKYDQEWRMIRPQIAPGRTYVKMRPCTVITGLRMPEYQRRLVRSAAKVAGISDIREMYIDDSDRLNSRPTKEE